MEDYEKEQYLHDALAELQERYAKAAEPYIDRLAFIRSLRPPPPIIVTLEQAQQLGLMPPNVQGQPTACGTDNKEPTL